MGNQSATATLRNCQRGTIFLTFLPCVAFFIITTLKLIKNKLDKASQGDQGKKYEQQNKAKPQQTNEQIGNIAKKKSESESEPQTPFDKFLQKSNQFQVTYMPFFLIFVTNLIMGASFSFSIVVFFGFIFSVVTLNLLKLYKNCGSNKCINILLMNISYFTLLMWFINQWTIIPATDPYFIYVAP